MEMRDVLQAIELTWKPIRNRSYAGMLGEHQLACVLQHEGEQHWKWLISGCNGSTRTDFRSAETLDDAKKAVQDGVETWFRKAGLLS